jgi:hypothetical protein
MDQDLDLLDILQSNQSVPPGFAVTTQSTFFPLLADGGKKAQDILVRAWVGYTPEGQATHWTRRRRRRRRLPLFVHQAVTH